MSERLNTESLQMAWSLVPWDQEVCGFPVLQITDIKVVGRSASEDIREFERRRDILGAGLVSCRLSHECLIESMLLEEHGFRFIEMLYQPLFQFSTVRIDVNSHLLSVSLANQGDLEDVLNIACSAFKNERFKMDFRLDPSISDQRFQLWVENSLNHYSQDLFVIRDGARAIAFFVTELQDDGTCYWHLNAIAPDVQGKGYGRRVWLSMLNHAFESGAMRVSTCIAARNHRVLNLYARLGFYFPPPLMTFHWVRQG